MSATVSSIASRRAFLIGSVFAAAAAGAFAVKPRRSEDRLLRHNLADLIPRTIGPWNVTTLAGMVVATADQAAPAEGYDQLLTRVYRADGLPAVMLLLAYGSTQGGSLQLHRPETCYPGQGFHLDAFSDVDLDLGTGAPVHARRFTARRDDRVERLTYWTRVSDRFPTNTAEEYGSIITSVARGYVPDGLLLRMSSLEGDGQAIDDALAQFARAMVVGASPAGRNLLVGNSRAAAPSQTAVGHNR